MRLIRRIRPSGTTFTIPAVRACTRALAVSTRVRTESVRPSVSGTVSASSSSRSRSFARSSGERGWRNARAVGVSCAARLSGPTAVASNERGALDRERARPHRLARAAHRGLGLARQVGLVQGEPVGRHHRPVGDDLIAGRQAHEVPHHHPVDGHAAVDPVAHDHRLWRDERGEPVERALGADLLERSDRDVREQDPEEERVLPRPERDRQHAEEEQDPVRDVQRVRADETLRVKMIYRRPPFVEPCRAR